MYNEYKIIDADGHIMEPVDLWEKYLEPQYKWFPISHTLLGGDPPSFSFNLWINGTKANGVGVGPRPWQPSRTPRPRYIKARDGSKITWGDFYAPWVKKGFSAESWLEYADMVGIDYAVLYPTVALFTTGLPGMDPKVADALCRAYNNWLYDYCNQGRGRLFGAAKVDPRDPELAAKEAHRCVKELGFKAVYIFPQMEQSTALSDPRMDVLWQRSLS